ncbi:hypothetical protein Nepgr_017325 [Nepenthes gracilis]|uniref:Uncharacterized protein n=1 Tax=Nepenthes gracilis TaxID=150966 RepID=A0AAD3SR95_NEPGR|nr:hypothetical protein Nepgr_017325 [Nepenthes gracilis]
MASHGLSFPVSSSLVATSSCMRASVSTTCRPLRLVSHAFASQPLPPLLISVSHKLSPQDSLSVGTTTFVVIASKQLPSRFNASTSCLLEALY